MTAKEIIKLLGGKEIVGDYLKISHFTVKGWYDRNRIPPEWTKELRGMADDIGKTLTSDDILESYNA